MKAFGSPHRILRRLHLWIAFGLGLLLVPLGLAGCFLVFAAEIDRVSDPALYAVTGDMPTRELGDYIADAGRAVPGAAVVRIRYPEPGGGPVVVLLRRGNSNAGGLSAVYLDPPSGRVLGVRDPRGGFIGFVHSFHADLLLPAFNGRGIVGGIGIGLLALSLTGLWLWWPRNGGFARGLRWRRGPATSVNFHHSVGFWISVPLAIMAVSGVTLSYPQQARSVIGLFAETAPRPEQGGKPLARAVQDPDTVAGLAIARLEGARLTTLFFPTERARVWRAQLALGEERRIVTVEDATGAVALLPDALPGDAFAATLRRLHEADHHGPVWRAIVLAAGLAPSLLLLTGLLMWLRRRRLQRVPLRRPHETVAFPASQEQDAAA